MDSTKQVQTGAKEGQARDMRVEIACMDKLRVYLYDAKGDRHDGDQGQSCYARVL